MMLRMGLPVRNVTRILLLTVALLLSAGLSKPWEVEAAGIALRLPFDDHFRLSAFFDHDQLDGNYVTVYTGEKCYDSGPDDPDPACTYDYRLHKGTDWALPSGTPVLAAAEGTVVECNYRPAPWGTQALIQHRNGYYTRYAHLSRCDVGANDQVQAGQQIGLSGKSGTKHAHLHLSVYCQGGGTPPDPEDMKTHVTDPFGWRGSYEDPLNDYGVGHTAACLWLGLPGDDVSCFDHIIEDDSAGWTESTAGIGWFTSTVGNGAREHHTCNWLSAYYWTKWDAEAGGYNPISHRGFYQISAYIPNPLLGLPRTINAPYTVKHVNGSNPEYVNQSGACDEWELLETYQLDPDQGNHYVKLWDNTGEAECSH